LYSDKSPSHGKISYQFFRYVITGMITFILGMAQFKLLHIIIPRIEYHNTYTWIINFFIGTLWLHAIHRRFTFKDASYRSYYSSLFRTYVSYGSTLVLGSFIMMMLCDIGNVHHLLGWALINTIMSFTNFYVLRTFAMVSVE